MKMFYNILFVSPKPVIDERISIALFFVSTNRVFFKYSKSKLKSLNGILAKPELAFINEYLNDIEKNVKNMNDSRRSESDISLPFDRNIFFESKFSYLNRYNNNLIQYSKLREITLSNANEESFHKLFNTFVFEERHSKKEKSFKDRINDLKSALKPKIEKYVDLDFSIDNLDEENILPVQSLLPKTLDMFGKNEHFMASKFFNFESRIDTVANQINSYDRLINSFSNAGHFFFIGDEPKKSDYPEQHSIWRYLDKKDKPYIKLIPIDEADMTLDYAQKHNVKPYSKRLQKNP